MEKLLNLNSLPTPSNVNVNTGKPLLKQQSSQDSFKDSSFDFDKSGGLNLEKESASFTGRPSLFMDDGRESLGILPQFNERIQLKSHLQHVLENPDSFLVSPGIGKGDETATVKETLELLPKEEEIHEDKNYLLVEFERNCEEIEKDRSEIDVHDVTDEHYSVYVEANFLASKIADNSIMDISQEGGTILDKTPQPDLVEEEDSIGPEGDQKKDTNAVHKQLDKMLPPQIDNSPVQENITNLRESNESTEHERDSQIECTNLLINNASKNLKEVLDLLTMINNQHQNSKLHLILSNTMKDISELIEREEYSNPRNSNVDEDDSGHSSTENEKEQRDAYGVIDLSLKAASTELVQAMDLSFKETVPCRMSITFSHKNDPALPNKHTSNNLKQQTMHMKKLWGSVSTKPTSAPSSEGEGSIMSAHSNDSSKISNPSSSTGSMKTKLKPKKSEPEIIKKGPMKAVVPLTSLNTSLSFDQPVHNQFMMPKGGKQRTPKTNPRPVAQSTPEELSCVGGKRKMQYPISPLARPCPSRTTIDVNRTRRLNDLNRSDSLPEFSVVSKPLLMGKVNARANCVGGTLNRRRSAADLKRPVEVETNANGKSKLTLRRCYSVSGKENLTTLHQDKHSLCTNKANYQSRIKPPQKNIAMKPFNLVEKLKNGK